MHRTWLVSDPLTREIGETRATALSLGLESTYLSLTGFLLRSQYDDTLDVQNKLHDWGGALRFTLGVITSYSIHYTKLYDTPALPLRQLRQRRRDARQPGRLVFRRSARGP